MKKNIFSSEIVKEIEGVGPKSGKVLANAGVKTLEDFRRADIKRLSEATGINSRRLSNWKSAAVLRQITGIDRQIAEVQNNTSLDRCISRTARGFRAPSVISRMPHRHVFNL